MGLWVTCVRCLHDVWMRLQCSAYFVLWCVVVLRYQMTAVCTESSGTIESMFLTFAESVIEVTLYYPWQPSVNIYYAITAVSSPQMFMLGKHTNNNWTPVHTHTIVCLLYTSPSPRDATLSRMPSSA